MEQDQPPQTTHQEQREEDDSQQPDPALLAAMGFSSFGAPPKPNKRQKLDSTTFTSNDAQSESNVPVRLAATPAATSTTTSTASAGTVGPSWQTDDLDTLAKGVRCQNGDVAFFKPSFIEDPWRDLVKGKP